MGSGMVNSACEKNVLLESHEDYPLIFSRIKDLRLSVRAVNGLRNAGKEYLVDVLLMDEKDCRRIKNFGSKTIAEVKLLLEEHGFTFNMSIPGWQPNSLDDELIKYQAVLDQRKREDTLYRLYGESGTIPTYLEDELAAIVNAFSSGDIATQIVTELLGWDGTGKKSYRSVAEKYDLLSTSVKDVLKNFKNRIFKYPCYDICVMSTVLTQVLSALRLHHQLNNHEKELMLVRVGLTKSPFKMSGIISAFDMFFCDWRGE